MNSLAASKLLQAWNKSENLKVSPRPVSPDCCGSIAPEIPLTEEQYSSVQSVLDDLKELHICTTVRTRTPAHIMDAPTCITVLIHVAPSLERLSISQDYFFGELSNSNSIASRSSMFIALGYILSISSHSSLNQRKLSLFSRYLR